MSIGIYLREVGGELWIESLDPITMVGELAEAKRWPNLIAAQEEHARRAENIPPSLRLEAVAADPCGEYLPIVLCELEALVEVEQTPLRGAVELFASLRKSSKYFHQFNGWQKVDAVIAPSWGDAYCFRVAHNAYRHEDLIFAVKLADGEMAQLDKWVEPKAERQVAA